MPFLSPPLHFTDLELGLVGLEVAQNFVHLVLCCTAKKICLLAMLHIYASVSNNYKSLLVKLHFTEKIDMLH